MQDKQVHIDEKFTDQAWDEMRKMLDQELPVKRQRRRFAWWWFTLLVGGTLLGGTLLWRSQEQQPEPLQPTQNQPVASATLPPVKEESSDFEATTSALSNEVSEPDQTARIVAEKPSTFSNTKKPVRSAKLKTKLSSTLPATAPHQFVAENSIQSSESIAKIEQQKQVENAAYRAFEQNLMPVLPTKTFDRQSQANKAVKPFLKQCQTCNFALQVSALTLPNFTSGGASVDFLAEKRLFGEKLKLGVGLGYTYLRQPIYTGISYGFSSATSDTLGKVIYANANNGAADELFDPAFSNFQSQVLQLHYLQMPVQISYQLTRRFSVNAGGAIGLLLSSKSEYVNNGVLNDLTNLGRAESKYLAGAAKSNITLFDFSLFGGLGCQLTKKASLHLDYVHGVKDVITLNRTNDVNRTLKLGLRYQLCGKR